VLIQIDRELIVVQPSETKGGPVGWQEAVQMIMAHGAQIIHEMEIFLLIDDHVPNPDTDYNPAGAFDIILTWDDTPHNGVDPDLYLTLIDRNRNRIEPAPGTLTTTTEMARCLKLLPSCLFAIGVGFGPSGVTNPPPPTTYMQIERGRAIMNLTRSPVS
jgi:hypothetical protein